MKKELCIDAFRHVTKRYKLRGRILHSDRGSQYTNEAFREALSKAGVKQRLSGVNHCYDNSRMKIYTYPPGGYPPGVDRALQEETLAA